MHSRSTGQFAVITAGSVTAQTFTLVNPSGVTVGEYLTTLYAGAVNPSLTFYVNNASYSDGWIRWSNSQPGTGPMFVYLKGPTVVATGNTPLIELSASAATPFSQIALSADRVTATAFSYVTVNAPTISLQGAVTLGDPTYGSATKIAAQDFVNEGGEINLLGAGTYGTCIIDNYQGLLRLFAAGGSGVTLDAGANIVTPGYLSITGGPNGAGNIRFSAGNPYIVASDYIHMPGGLYVSGGNLWVQNTCHVRGATGLYNDTGNLIVSGGSSGVTAWASTGFQSIASTTGYQALYWNTTFGNVARFTSSRKLKENIVTLSGSGEVIDALRPVTFVPKALGEETETERAWRLADIQHGFIAEEVAEVDNGRWAVWEPDNEGGLRPIVWRHHDMTALLVAETQDLRRRLAALEAGNPNTNRTA